MKNFKKAFLVFGIIFSLAILGCSKNNNTIVIYSCGEDYRNEYYLAELQKQFPEINFVLDYQGSGPAAAKLKAEGREKSGSLGEGAERRGFGNSAKTGSKRKSETGRTEKNGKNRIL